MKSASVAAGIARKFLDYAAECGAPRHQLYNRTGLSPTALADQDARIPLATYQTLIAIAIELTGDPAIVLHYCTATRIEDISIVGLIVHASPSMADSLVQLNRYARLMVEVDVMESGERFTVEPEGEQIWIVDNRPDPNSFPELTESAFGHFIGEFSRHFPDRPFALALQVTHPAPGHAAAYEEILRVPVTFAAPRNAMQIEPAWLQTPFENSGAYVFGIFADRADALMARLESDRSVRARIEAHLLTNLHRGDITMDQVATELGMSRQTLYRRLRDEQTTFASIHDDLRRRMAVDYLGARKVSVNETAYLVGFSEASSFVRAFRRWTGETPLAFREAAGRAPG